jgi:hypothetical protein
MKDTNKKGNLTEIEVQFLFLKNNFRIFQPVGDGNKIDLIIIFPESKIPKRVQIKTSRQSPTGFKFNAYSQLGTRGGKQEKRRYTIDDIDFFATAFDEKLYLIPIEDVGNRAEVSLVITKIYRRSLCDTLLTTFLKVL